MSRPPIPPSPPPRVMVNPTPPTRPRPPPIEPLPSVVPAVLPVVGAPSRPVFATRVNQRIVIRQNPSYQQQTVRAIQPSIPVTVEGGFIDRKDLLSKRIRINCEGGKPDPIRLDLTPAGTLLRRYCCDVPAYPGRGDLYDEIATGDGNTIPKLVEKGSPFCVGPPPIPAPPLPLPPSALPRRPPPPRFVTSNIGFSNQPPREPSPPDLSPQTPMPPLPPLPPTPPPPPPPAPPPPGTPIS